MSVFSLQSSPLHSLPWLPGPSQVCICQLFALNLLVRLPCCLLIPTKALAMWLLWQAGGGGIILLLKLHPIPSLLAGWCSRYPGVYCRDIAALAPRDWEAEAGSCKLIQMTLVRLWGVIWDWGPRGLTMKGLCVDQLLHSKYKYPDTFHCFSPISLFSPVQQHFRLILLVLGYTIEFFSSKIESFALLSSIFSSFFIC